MKRVWKKLLTAVMVAVMAVTSTVGVSALGASDDRVRLAGNVVIGETVYENLNAAVQSVQAGQVIELGSDQELNVCSITKPVTINGNGYTVTVPAQTNAAGKLNDGDGRLLINQELTFKNAVVSFGNTNSWSVVMGSNGVLNLLEGSVCNFSVCGIYTSPNAEINVDASSMKLENMKYTSMMAEAYATLNVTNGSTFLIKEPMSINGITGFKINVDRSSFTVRDCGRQGLVKCDLVLTNGANVLLDNDYTGYNMYGGNQMIVNEGTTVTIRNCGSRAIMTQGRDGAEILVKAGGTLDVQYNGKAWTADDAESNYYANKGAITVGCYGWYPSRNEILFYDNSEMTFEDGANVNISNNYVRGIFNNGTTYIGNTTQIVNNGMTEGTEECRVGAGGGIYNRADLTVAAGAELYNNHARIEADDLYNENGKKLVLAQTGSDWVLNDCGDAITGWFHDGYRAVEDGADTTRWNAVQGERNCMGREGSYIHEYAVGAATTERLSLKAAHPGLVNVVVRYYQGSVTTPDDASHFLGSAAFESPFIVGSEIVLSSGANATELNFLKPQGYDSGRQVGRTPYVVIDGEENVINVLYLQEEEIVDPETPLDPGNEETPTGPQEETIDDGAVPKTGDAMNVALFAALMVLSLAIGYMFRKKFEK